MSLSQRLPQLLRGPRLQAGDHESRGAVNYGVGLNDMIATGGTDRTVLAYEREVPEKGGIILFGDGHVDTVQTPAEFANLPKASKGQKK